MQAVFDPWLTAAVVLDVAAAARSSAAALLARQRQRVTELLRAARAGSPLYRRRLAGVDPQAADLRGIAPVGKPELMRHFDQWLTDRAVRLDELHAFVADPQRIAQPYLGRYVVWESSGSSGEPAIFVQDAHALAVYDALEGLRRAPTQLMKRALDPMYLSERIAFVGATGGHFAGTVTMRRLRQVNAALAPHLHEVSFLQPEDRIAAQLDALRPTIIATYPSAALMLAEARAAGRLHAAPEEIWTGGETLTPALRGHIAQAFGCRVIDTYGASEFLSIASECRLGRLHLNSDWVVLESVDARGHAVPAGEFGDTTLLTNLANHVQPLIRYDLRDRVALMPSACSCGSPLPWIRVQGRSDDTLVLPRRGGGRVRILPLALSTVLEEEAGLFDFQLEQAAERRLCLRTSLSGAEATTRLQQASHALDAFLTRQGALHTEIECSAACCLQHARGGKIARVLAQPT
jgi:phenylacetate-coenzyme A ligase PaaK-like adenylate-forming protein